MMIKLKVSVPVLSTILWYELLNITITSGYFDPVN